MSSPSELAPVYPPTLYVEQVASDLPPPGVDLIRTVCVAEWLGQGDIELTHRLAELSARDVEYWLEDERADYGLVRWEVERFFKLNGAADLAEASVAGVSHQEARRTRDARALFINRVWGVCERNLPDSEQLTSRLPMHKQMVARNEQVLEGRTTGETFKRYMDFPGTVLEVWRMAGTMKSRSAIASLLMSVDRASIARGRPPGAFAEDAYESVARELVLARRPTGSAIFNLLGARLQDTALTRLVDREMAELEATWAQHHAQETFIPEQYADVAAARPRGERAALRIFGLLARLHPAVDSIQL